MLALFRLLWCVACLLLTRAQNYPSGWDTALTKIQFRVKQMQRRVDVSKRSLIIYHIGNMGLASNSLDVAGNNVKLFISSVERHSRSSLLKAFYIFNIVDLDNSLVRLIPASKANVALLQWNNSRSDLDTHLKTVQLLGSSIISNFSTVIFSNQGVRGPLIRRDNGEWIGDFNRALQSDNVGMVGPTISCEMSPHVQTHMFALRAELVPVVLEAMKLKMEKEFKDWRTLIASMEVGLTGVVTNAGYNVSSFMHQSYGQAYFQHCLQYQGTPHRFDKNPTGWCGASAEGLIFVKWGGELLRSSAMACSATVSQMETHLERVAAAEPELQLVVPEALRAGRLYPLFKAYAQEAWIDRHPVLSPSLAQRSAANGTAAQPKVCFLVRVIRPLHSTRRYENAHSHLLNTELELLLTTLRRQSNPDWVAMLFRIDSSPSHDEILQVVESLADPRVEYNPSESDSGVKYSTADAGYAVTDRMLSRALQRGDCAWISVTTSDNAYGSKVVHNVLTSENKADVVINPMDSRRLYQRELLRRSGRASSTNILPIEEYCSFQANLVNQSFTFVAPTDPAHDQLELAAAFLSSAKLMQEKVRLSDFADARKYACPPDSAVTDPSQYRCLNARGAHVLHHVLHRRAWTAARLPVRGLHSVVFHGNSPTLCIGAGNTWLDHLDPAQARCMTGRDAIAVMDHPSQQPFVVDFPHFGSQGQMIGTCMRLKSVKPSGWFDWTRSFFSGWF